MGVLTQGSEENLFPGFAIPNPDCARDYALYNLLFYPNEATCCTRWCRDWHRPPR